MRSRVGLGMTCLVTMSMGLLLLLPAQLYPRLSFPVGVGDARREEGVAAAARRRDPPKPGKERRKEPAAAILAPSRTSDGHSSSDKVPVRV
jgi:hypothetical protein